MFYAKHGKNPAGQAEAISAVSGVRKIWCRQTGLNSRPRHYQ